MPYNAECDDSASDICASNYRDRLNCWAIARLLPNLQRAIVARFRSRSDADGYLQFLRQHMPEADFVVLFDVGRGLGR